MRSADWIGRDFSDAFVVRTGVGALSLATCLFVTVPAVMFSFMTAGAGHGNFFLLDTLFPYTNLFMRYLAHSPNPMGFYVVMLIQFPIYGIILFVAAWRGWVWYGLASILIVVSHIVAVKF
jgi:hypothetical protein